MSKRKYTMPSTPKIGRAGEDGGVELNEGYQAYFGAIEDLSQRISGNVAPLAGVTTAATMSAKIDALIAALIAGDVMKAS